MRVEVPPIDITGLKEFQTSKNVYHYQRIAVAIPAGGYGLPWKLLRLDVRRGCRGNWRGPAMGCRSCYTEVYHGQNHGTCRGHHHGICRGSAMIRGPCRGHSRIFTVAGGKTHGRPRKSRGHCRGPPPKSPNVQACWEGKQEEKFQR